MRRTYEQVKFSREHRDQGTAIYFRLRGRLFRLSEDPAYMDQPVIEPLETVHYNPAFQAPLAFLMTVIDE
jgi:hypothetical protein